MIRVDIESIIMAVGSSPSVIVLRERAAGSSSESSLRALSIQTGAFEASSINHGAEAETPPRPITHDLMMEGIHALGGKIERVEINRVDAPVFFASVVLEQPEGDAKAASREIKLDARPSDALALAVRANAPIYVEDDVMNRAGNISFHAKQESKDEECARFDQFVQTLSPDDF